MTIALRNIGNEKIIMDSFAGGGGASTGIEMALGRSPDLAINHNAAALALHAANHPETLHLSENVYKVDPLDYLRGRKIGLAWFSPDCKHFSKAKGGKPVERNIRDLCWIIPGWVERIQKSGGSVDVIIMENVEEFKDYGPLMETDRGLMPDPARRGETFKKWCRKLRSLGGKIEYSEIRACDHGAPTIRKRLFVIIRFDGKPIVWPTATHGAPDDADVIAGHKLRWRTAAEIIDWSLPCPSIFDTAEQIFDQMKLRAVRPLADNTMARVARGMKRYVLDAEQPFLVNLTHGGRLDNLAEPARTVTGAHRGEKALVSPHLSAYYGDGDGGKDRAAPADEPVRVIPCENRHAVIAPSVLRFNTGATASEAREPLPTITANSFIKRPGGAAPLGLLAPVITAAQHGGSVRSAEEPHHTITASSKDQNAVIVPTLVGCGGRAGQSRPRGGDESLATVTAKADVCIATAFVAQHNIDGHSGLGNPGRSAEAPLSTITATGAQQGVVSAFISRQFGASVGLGADEPSATITAGVNKSALVTPYLVPRYGERAGQEPRTRPIDVPAPVVVPTGNGGQLVAPHLHAYYGSDQDTPENEPFHTITTKPRFSHVEANIQAPPFTPDQHARAREVADFMRAHGFWDDREFVTIDIGDCTFVIVDIGMRMLTPRELYNAQGFPVDYIIDNDGKGNAFTKSVQVSCVGNSVSPPVAAALVAANCGDLRRQAANDNSVAGGDLGVIENVEKMHKFG